MLINNNLKMNVMLSGLFAVALNDVMDFLLLC